MREIARLARTKIGATVLFLGGGSIWILCRPLWEPGGLNALVAGEGDGRMWWPILAVCALFLLPMAAMLAWKLARYTGPAVFIRDGIVHAVSWKLPVPARMIVDISATKARFFAGRPSTIVLKLADGTERWVFGLYLTEDVYTVARRLAEVLDLPERSDADLHLPPLS